MTSWSYLCGHGTEMQWNEGWFIKSCFSSRDLIQSDLKCHEQCRKLLLDFMRRIESRIYKGKLILQLADNPCEQRLWILHLKQGDWAEMFKLIKEGVNMKHCSLSSTSTRGHIHNLDVGSVLLHWGQSMSKIVACNSLRIFKSKTDKFLKGLLPFAKATNKTHPHCDQSH